VMKMHVRSVEQIQTQARAWEKEKTIFVS